MWGFIYKGFSIPLLPPTKLLKFRKIQKGHKGNIYKGVIMSYVYRYTDLSDNVIKYVGIVCREGEDALSRRIEEHSYNDSWCFNKTWKIEYIKVPTKNDANALESHFIAKWETHKWFNIKKKHDGLLSFIKCDFKWIVEKEALFVK